MRRSQPCCVGARNHLRCRIRPRGQRGDPVQAPGRRQWPRRSASRARCESAIALFRSKWWLIGFAVAAVAWGFHVIAMALAPLSMVQVVTAGGLALLALPSAAVLWHSPASPGVGGPVPQRVRARVAGGHRRGLRGTFRVLPRGAPGLRGRAGRRRRHAPPQGLQGPRPRAKRRHAGRCRRNHGRRRERLDEGAHRRRCRRRRDRRS